MCQNEGVCSLDEGVNPGYSCECTPPYGGDQCKVKVKLSFLRGSEKSQVMQCLVFCAADMKTDIKTKNQLYKNPNIT